jgi:hypothetical protein
MAISPVGAETENDCAGEDQQQFTRPDTKKLTVKTTTPMFAEKLGDVQYSNDIPESRSHVQIMSYSKS